MIADATPEARAHMTTNVIQERIKFIRNQTDGMRERPSQDYKVIHSVYETSVFIGILKG